VITICATYIKNQITINYTHRSYLWVSAIISLNSINQLLFVMVQCGVLFEVRTEFVNILATDWMTGRSGFVPWQRQKIFPLASCVQTSSEAHPASCTMGTGGPFPGGKARPGYDADHSPHLLPSQNK
jgi:hypothetical protein